MIRALSLIAIGLVTMASSAWAYRIIEQPEDAYELTLGMVRLPASERAAVVFRACEDCRTTSMRVTADTRYFANGAPITLKELNDIAADLLATAAGRNDTLIYIYYDVASLRINRLAISYRS